MKGKVEHIMGETDQHVLNVSAVSVPIEAKVSIAGKVEHNIRGKQTGELE